MGSDHFVRLLAAPMRRRCTYDGWAVFQLPIVVAMLITLSGHFECEAQVSPLAWSERLNSADSLTEAHVQETGIALWSVGPITAAESALPPAISVKDPQDKPAATLILLQDGGAPAPAPPPPPDPAAIAAAAAIQEKTEKGAEKTKKNEAEEARKHAKREEFRAKQKAKLKAIQDEADQKITKERDHKTSQLKIQQDTRQEGAEKMKKSLEGVQKDKEKAAAAIATKTAENAKKEADQEKAVASIAAKAKAADATVIATVMKNIAAVDAKMEAKAAVKFAKIKKKEAADGAKTQQVLATGLAAMNKRFADDATAHAKLKAETNADLAKIKKKSDDDKAAEAKKLADFHGSSGKLAKMEANEAKEKKELEAETAKAVAYASKHNPAFRKVKRLQRHQRDVTKHLLRQATRHELRELHRSHRKFEHMTQQSGETFAGLTRDGISALRKEIETDDAPLVNSQVAHAWGLAVGEAPNRAEAEALTRARGGVADLIDATAGPKGEVIKAWKGALGGKAARDPRDRNSGPIDEETQNAFAVALGLVASGGEAREEDDVREAWRSVLRREADLDASTNDDDSLSQVLGFGKAIPGDLDPPPEEIVDSSQSAPPVADFLEVALAAESSRPLPHIPKRAMEILARAPPATPFSRARQGKARQAEGEERSAAEEAVASVLQAEKHTQQHPEEGEALLRLSPIERSRKPKKRLAVAVVQRSAHAKAVVVNGDDAVVGVEEVETSPDSVVFETSGERILDGRNYRVVTRAPNAAPTPGPTVVTAETAELTQAVTFTSISSPDAYTGDTKRVVEDSYAMSIGLASFQEGKLVRCTGCSVASSASQAVSASDILLQDGVAGGSGVEVTFYLGVPRAQVQATGSAVQTLTPAALTSALAEVAAGTPNSPALTVGAMASPVMLASSTPKQQQASGSSDTPQQQSASASASVKSGLLRANSVHHSAGGRSAGATALALLGPLLALRVAAFG